jgi:putative ABC transport system substrate-binding protein
VAIDYRWAESHYDRLPELAADLVGRKVDVIAAAGGPSALAAKNATSTIRIVFAGGADPIGGGLVMSLARPGSNLTGFSVLAGELNPKRLELLSELVPQAGVIALVVNPNNPNAERISGDVRKAARDKRLQLHILKAGTESEIGRALARGLLGAGIRVATRRPQKVRFAIDSALEQSGFARVAPRELRRFPTISHGVLSLQGAVKRWIGGQFF